MSLEWFIARRYLFSRERNALISANTLISVLGVAVGVAALVVVIGVMDGAFALMAKQVTSIAPHVRYIPLEADDEHPAQLDPAVLAGLRARPGVARADAMSVKPAFMQLPNGAEAQKEGIQLCALDEVGPSGPFAFNLPADFKPVALGEDQIALGRPLAQKLGVQVGGIVQVLVQTRIVPGSSLPFRPFMLHVVALVDAGYYEFDSRSAFVNGRLLQEMFPGSTFEFVSIKLRDPSTAPEFAAAVQLPGFSSETWQKANAFYFSSLKLQKYGLFIILSLIIFVSAFNIIGTLILMVTEKTREIGILSAMGAGRAFVGRLFLLIGVMIGMAGTTLGLVLGVGIALLVPHAPIKMPVAIYNFERLPMDIRPVTLLMIAGAALVICTVGALIPAWQAARLHPAEAVRYD